MPNGFERLPDSLPVSSILLRAAAGARGLYVTETAVELLIGHGRWLARDDFVDSFVGTSLRLADGTAIAWVDLRAAIAALDAGLLPWSASDAGLLRIATRWWPASRPRSTVTRP
jgi:hypothetical protein